MDTAVRPRLMGLDVSRKRIGIALSDSLWLAASPRDVLHRTSRRADYAFLCRLIQDEAVEEIVCGLPVWEQTENRQARYIREWALRFVQAQRVLLPLARRVIFWDEQYTSAAARWQQQEMGAARGPEDALAAAILLEDYMRAQARGTGHDLGDVPA